MTYALFVAKQDGVDRMLTLNMGKLPFQGEIIHCLSYPGRCRRAEIIKAYSLTRIPPRSGNLIQPKATPWGFDQVKPNALEGQLNITNMGQS